MVLKLPFVKLHGGLPLEVFFHVSSSLEYPFLTLIVFFSPICVCCLCVIGFQFAGGYEYIEVMLKAAINGVKATRLIVDMDFRSQFELARPTPTYTDLINTLPSIFVGNEEKLNKIISLLCAAAKQSLKERGLHIPPWRKANHMQSKWLSENCKKVPIFPAPKSNTEVGGMDKWESKAPQCSSKFSKWVPPVVKPRTRGMDGGGSALSSQFSNMGINCC